MPERAPHESRHNVNLWFVPLKMSGAAVLLFALTLTLDTLAAYHRIHIPDWFTMGSIDDARAILSAMLGCVSTVLALIFSVALLVLSMVANLFGPRLLYRFVQDWVTQTCIGLFMAAFIFVFLTFLVTHQDAHSSFVPQVSLITSWVLVLSAFAFLVFYSHRVAVLIQNPDAIGRIVDDLRHVVHSTRSPHDTHSPASHAEDVRKLAEHAAGCAPIAAATSGYLQLINFQRLIDAAAQSGALLVVPFRPGQFVLEGETLATVSPAAQAAAMTPHLRQAVSLGRHRVLAQDVEFGIAQIVEIGIRALSPAVNDTFTGVACVDLLGESLTLIAEVPPSTGRWYDGAHQLRLQVRPLLVPRLIKQAFDQIRQAAADNPAVSLRLLTTLTRLAARMPTPEDHTALLEQARAVWESATSSNPIAADRRDLEAAWTAARSALDGVAAQINLPSA